MKFKDYLEESKLRASSGSEEGIKKLISDFFYGSTITLEKISDNEWSVFNKKGKINSYRVIKKGKQFRFEEI